MKICEKKQGETNLIIIDNGVLKITFASLGASIYSILFNNEEMLLTPKDIEEFLSDNYYGKTIGRVNNRVENGLFIIKNQEYHLPTNEENNTFNSASEGIHNAQFKYMIESKSLETIIKFSYLSREDKQSLPGDVYLTVTYKIKENDSRIFLTIEALSNKETPLAFSNQLCFSLGTHGLEDKKLQILASKFIHTNRSSLLPLYKVDVPSCLKYLELKPALFDINNLFLQDHASFGLNHNFIFDFPSLRKTNLIFENAKYRLSIKTDYECVHVSSCNYPDGIEKVTGQSKKYEGLVIEPEENIQNRTIDKKFVHNTIYIFDKK